MRRTAGQPDSRLEDRPFVRCSEDALARAANNVRGAPAQNDFGIPSTCVPT